MKIKEAIQVLEKSMGENVYNVYVPSIKMELPFKPMTAGQQKTVSKLSIDTTDEDYISYQAARLALIKSCCLEDIDVEEITIIDFISILSDMKKNNSLDEMKLQLTCNKKTADKSCDNTFNFSIDFDYILDQCKNFEFKTIKFEKECKDIKFEFILKEPKIIDFLSYQYQIYNSDTDEDVKELTKNTIGGYPILFIREMYIDGELVEDFDDLDYGEKIQFINDNIYGDIIYNKEDSVLSTVIEHFMGSRLDNLFQNVTCPKCKDIKESVVTFDNFFTI